MRIHDPDRRGEDRGDFNNINALNYVIPGRPAVAEAAEVGVERRIERRTVRAIKVR